MLNDRNNLITLILAALVAVASWWWLQVSTPEQENALVVEKHSANYYSLGYQKQEMDAFGLLNSEVKAAKMMHYGDDGSIHLEQPEIRFFDKKLPPWVIKADSGVLTSNGKELWLNGLVLVSRSAAEGSRAITIKTSDLRVQPETSYAETVQWAELSSPPDVTSGIGLQLYFSDPIRITLLNKVRGKYEIH